MLSCFDKNISRLFSYLERHTSEIFWGICATFLTNIASLFIPELLKRAINCIVDGVSHRYIVYYALGILLSAAMQGLFRFLARYLLISVSRKVEYEMRGDLFSHIQKLPMSFFSEHKTGDLMSRLTNDIEDVRMMLGPGFMYTLNSFIILLAACVMLVRISPELAFYSLSSFVLFIFYVKSVSHKLHDSFKHMRKQTANVTSFLQEYFSGIQLFKIYCQEKQQQERFSEASEEYLKSNIELIKVLGSFVPSISFISGFSSLIILYFGGLKVISGNISLGDFVAFGTYLSLLITPVVGLGWASSLFQKGKVALGRFGEVFVQTAEELGDTACDKLSAGSIRFENISFRYPGSSVDSLSEVSFNIPKGSVVAIVGVVGSGKSTLAKLLPRLMEPTAGNIYINDINCKEYSLRKLRSSIGFVPQQNFLFSGTILQNIMMDVALDEDDLDEIVLFSQLKHEIYDFPDKMDTMLGEKGINLSGGQKQRLSISRAFAAKPSILVLDDAFSSVDVETEKKIMAKLRHFTKDMTTFIISHRLTGVTEADCILVLSHGKIVEEGTHSTLMEKNGVYAKLFKLQVREKDLTNISLKPLC